MRETQLVAEVPRLTHNNTLLRASAPATPLDRGVKWTKLLVAAGMASLLMPAGVWGAVSLLRWFWREIF